MIKPADVNEEFRNEIFGLCRSGKLEAAVFACSNRLNQASADLRHDVLGMRAYVWRLKGTLSEARNDLIEACKLQPNSRRHYSALAEVEFLSGDYHSAISSAKKTLQLDADAESHAFSDESYFIVALSLLALGERLSARKWAEMISARGETYLRKRITKVELIQMLL